MEKRFDGLKDEVKSQNNRFWTLVLALFVALFGAIAKIWFLPNA
jgi:hypothetical protein